jgi:hypothetical protein
VGLENINIKNPNIINIVNISIGKGFIFIINLIISNNLIDIKYIPLSKSHSIGIYIFSTPDQQFSSAKSSLSISLWFYRHRLATNPPERASLVRLPAIFAVSQLFKPICASFMQHSEVVCYPVDCPAIVATPLCKFRIDHEVLAQFLVGSLYVQDKFYGCQEVLFGVEATTLPLAIFLYDYVAVL